MRGQLPVIFALVLGGLIISLALTVYHVSTFHMRFRSRRWIHPILNVEKDSGRAVSIGLAVFTREFNGSGDFSYSRAEAVKVFESWRLAFTIGYSNLGVKLSLGSNGLHVHEGFSFNVTVDSDTYECYVGELSIPPGEFFAVSWGGAYAVSAACLAVGLDIAHSGVLGWNYSAQALLTVKVYLVDSSGVVAFECRSERGYVSTLTHENVFIYENGTRLPVDRLEYIGLGCYTATLGEPIGNPFLVEVVVKDPRGILVKASLQGLM